MQSTYQMVQRTTYSRYRPRLWRTRRPRQALSPVGSRNSATVPTSVPALLGNHLACYTEATCSQFALHLWRGEGYLGAAICSNMAQIWQASVNVLSEEIRFEISHLAFCNLPRGVQLEIYHMVFDTTCEVPNTYNDHRALNLPIAIQILYVYHASVGEALRILHRRN
jgi:hypothetical protein